MQGATSGAAVAACMAFWFRVMFAKHRLFLLALVIYSAGAFGFEFLSTETLMRTGISAAYVAVTSLEELMEMLGCLLLLLATFRQLVPLSDIAPNNWSCQGPA